MATPLELLFDLVFVVAIAQAAAHLHHGIVEHHTANAIAGFLMAFAAIWWAWMNDTWFASAYDDDSAQFRVLTMVQMVGVLALAAGVPGFFEGRFNAGVAGDVLMRLAMCWQWVRAAQAHEQCRTTCLRDAKGIAIVQAKPPMVCRPPMRLPAWRWPKRCLLSRRGCLAATRSRAQQQDWFIPLICLACIALAPVAVSLGVPLQWGLLLLSVGPIIAIAHHEYGNRARPDAFAMR